MFASPDPRREGAARSSSSTHRFPGGAQNDPLQPAGGLLTVALQYPLHSLAVRQRAHRVNIKLSRLVWARDILKTEGVLSLYSGFVPHCAHSFAVGALSLLGSSAVAHLPGGDVEVHGSETHTGVAADAPQWRTDCRVSMSAAAFVALCGMGHPGLARSLAQRAAPGVGFPQPVDDSRPMLDAEKNMEVEPEALGFGLWSTRHHAVRIGVRLATETVAYPLRSIANRECIGPSRSWADFLSRIWTYFSSPDEFCRLWSGLTPYLAVTSVNCLVALGLSELARRQWAPHRRCNESMAFIAATGVGASVLTTPLTNQAMLLSVQTRAVKLLRSGDDLVGFANGLRDAATRYPLDLLRPQSVLMLTGSIGLGAAVAWLYHKDYEDGDGSVEDLDDEWVAE